MKKKKKKQSNLPGKEKVTYLSIWIKMQREISDKVFLGDTVSPLDDIGRSSAIERTASNYNDAKEKVKKIRELISTGRYDEDIAKIHP